MTFQGRYKSIVVDPEERSYLVVLSDYIHLNPVRAGLVKLEGRLFDLPVEQLPALRRGEWAPGVVRVTPCSGRTGPG